MEVRRNQVLKKKDGSYVPQRQTEIVGEDGSNSHISTSGRERNLGRVRSVKMN